MMRFNINTCDITDLCYLRVDTSKVVYFCSNHDFRYKIQCATQNVKKMTSHQSNTFWWTAGQLGFKGQAIFFAQQVEEVSEQLPIPIACAGITILAKSLQNMSSRLTYVVDAGKIKKALEYLKVNNQLYAIVQCNYDLSNNEINDIILKSVTTEQ